uniref:Uncharacterized protein n=1 Tax=Anguilla anguilla TaxID=7936 RepID=A0A0E9TLY7_ANGAN
MEGQKYRGLN